MQKSEGFQNLSLGSGASSEDKSSFVREQSPDLCLFADHSDSQEAGDEHTSGHWIKDLEDVHRESELQLAK